MLHILHLVHFQFPVYSLLSAAHPLPNEHFLLCANFTAKEKRTNAFLQSVVVALVFACSLALLCNARDLMVFKGTQMMVLAISGSA